MYGVVLMLAMSGASESPECGRLFHRCHGWNTCSCSCSGGYSYSCTGCFGCTGCSGVIVTPMTPATPPMPPTPPAPPLPAPAPVEGSTRTPATILVSLPGETVLYFDGVKMNPSSGTRRFSTPPLEGGKSYFYTVKAEVTQNGETVATTQRVIVRGGQQTQVQIEFTTSGALAARQY